MIVEENLSFQIRCRWPCAVSLTVLLKLMRQNGWWCRNALHRPYLIIYKRGEVNLGSCEKDGPISGEGEVACVAAWPIHEWTWCARRATGLRRDGCCHCIVYLSVSRVACSWMPNISLKNILFVIRNCAQLWIVSALKLLKCGTCIDLPSACNRCSTFHALDVIKFVFFLASLPFAVFMLIRRALSADLGAYIIHCMYDRPTSWSIID